MKSPFTNKEMELRREKESFPFRGEEISVIAHFYYCSDTEEEITTNELDNITLNQLYNEYRAKHNIPFKQEIIELRQKYDVSISDMAKILGFGSNTYGKYEKGEVPSRSNGKTLQLIKSTSEFRKLVKLADNLDEKKQEKILGHLDTLGQNTKNVIKEPLYSISPPEINQEPSIEMGYQALSWEKIKIMVRYFAKTEPYTAKLNKLMFYADFGHYKRTGYSISGIPYRAIAMGPVPTFYSSMYEYLNHIGCVMVRSHVFDTGNTGKQYYLDSEQKLDKEILECSEIEVLEEVLNQFSEVTTRDIINLSHEEQAWTAHEANNEIIDYTHAFYLKHL